MADTKSKAQRKTSLGASAGWGAWVKYPWDNEYHQCVRCGATLFLRDGHEWHDWPELNLCHSCALTILEEMRPNAELSGARPPLTNHNENVRTGERSLE